MPKSTTPRENRVPGVNKISRRDLKKLGVKDDDLPAWKKQSVIKMIEIRLKGISEATNRAKIAFIIVTVASCAMLITVFNSYYSFTRTRAFEGTHKFKALKIKDPSLFIDSLAQENGKIESAYFKRKDNEDG